MQPTQVNMILYRVGEAGNFLTRLFSLSQGTQFLWTQGTCGCKPEDDSLEEKIKWYWYYPEKIQNWIADAHNIPVGWDKLTQKDLPWEHNKILVSCIHYSHFCWNDTTEKHFNPMGLEIDECYFSVKVSDKNYNKLSKNFRYPNNQSAKDDALRKIKEVTNVHEIDLDKILENDLSFLEEYKRVCYLMGLVPVNDDIAFAFLKNWKSLRFM